jgi:hypothetical protein
MALPVYDSEDSKLSVKGLTAKEFTIGPNGKQLEEDTKGEIDENENENNANTFFNLANKSCKLGLQRSGRPNSPTVGSTSVKMQGPPTCSHCKGVGNHHSNKKCRSKLFDITA